MKVRSLSALLLATILSGAATAGEVEPKIDCSRFERLPNGIWRGKSGAVMTLHRSKIDLSETMLRRGGTRIDGEDVSIMLDRQCASKPARNIRGS